MGMKLECDLCKKAIADEMDILEVKYGRAGERPKDVLSGFVCPECQKALGLGEFLHKFKSMGAIDVLRRQMEQQQAQARVGQLGDTQTPVAVDPRLAGQALRAR